MPFAAGRHYLAIPGPSVMPDRVLQAMHRAAPNIYEGDLIRLTESLVPDLCALAGTRHHVAIYITNGHGTWEAAVSNLFQAGDKVLVLATGVFAPGWGEMASALGIDVEIMDFGKRAAVDLDRVADRLAADTKREIKAVMCVQVDTGTSVRNDVAGIRAVLDRSDHPALLMADCIATMGCEEFRMDAWGVDVTVAASQKGLMTPPGLGFVWFNDKAAKIRDGLPRVSRYWDWKPRVAPKLFSQYWNGTAPTHHLFGLREALDMIAEEGLDNVWARHSAIAGAYWAAFETWEAPGGVSLNIADRAKRSCAVTALRCTAPSATALRDWMQDVAGVTLGIGLGMAQPDDPAWHGFFRVGHMGHVNAHMAMGVIGALDSAFKANDIPHGAGAVEAASAFLAKQSKAAG